MCNLARSSGLLFCSTVVQHIDIMCDDHARSGGPATVTKLLSTNWAQIVMCCVVQQLSASPRYPTLAQPYVLSCPPHFSIDVSFKEILSDLRWAPTVQLLMVLETHASNSASEGQVSPGIKFGETSDDFCGCCVCPCCEQLVVQIAVNFTTRFACCEASLCLIDGNRDSS